MPSDPHVSAKRLGGVLSLVSCGLVVAACSPTPVVYTRESFAADSPYQKKVQVGAATACEGARRVLLGDGYVLDRSDGENVKGRKAYRSEGDRSTFVEMSVVCVADPAGTSLYANGLLSTYDVKKSTSSASVGVSAFGSVSLPFGQSVDSMVKTSDETITDREFYRRFFTAVDGALADMQLDKAAPTARPDAGRDVTAGAHKAAAQGNQTTPPKQPPAQAAPEPAQGPPSAAPEPPQGSQQAAPAPLTQPQAGAPGAPPPVTPLAMPQAAPSAPSAGPQGTVTGPQDAPPAPPAPGSPSTPVAVPPNAPEPAAARPPAPPAPPAPEGTQPPPGGAAPPAAPGGPQPAAVGAATTSAPPATQPAEPGAPAVLPRDGRQPAGPGTLATQPPPAVSASGVDSGAPVAPGPTPSSVPPGASAGASQTPAQDPQEAAAPHGAPRDPPPAPMP